ncbi:MAG: hypothetical protein ACO3EZ_03940 [Prochlorotrichaceae cyanobacterium]
MVWCALSGGKLYNGFSNLVLAIVLITIVTTIVGLLAVQDR